MQAAGVVVAVDEGKEFVDGVLLAGKAAIAQHLGSERADKGLSPGPVCGMIGLALADMLCSMPVARSRWRKALLPYWLPRSLWSQAQRDSQAAGCPKGERSKANVACPDLVRLCRQRAALRVGRGRGFFGAAVARLRQIGLGLEGNEPCLGHEPSNKIW